MTYKAEKIVPYLSSQESKGAQVEEMFDSIAENYDALNHTLSIGIDRGWRRKALRSLNSIEPSTILDVATGTGDLAIQAYDLLKPSRILGIDISEGMMNVARRKVDKLGLSEKITFEKQDCLNLTLEDNTFDAVMVAFGVRNFEDLDRGLTEILRVLRPGGKLMILELSTPQSFPMKQAYWIYSKLVIPTIGKLVSKNNVAYKYLPQSIKAFSQGKEMTDILTKNGYKDAKYTSYTLGICSMYLGTK